MEEKPYGGGIRPPVQIGLNFDTASFSHFGLCPTEQPSSDGNLIPHSDAVQLYVVEMRLHSNSNNLILHEAGNACWVLHSNHLTDSNDSSIFLWKTGESKKVFVVVGVNADCRLPTGRGAVFP